MTELYSRLSRVIGEVLDDLYATPGLRAEAVTAAVLSELDLKQEWRVEGDCNEASKDCDHLGDHGPWYCEAVTETREEAEALPVAHSPDAHIASHVVSPWIREAS